MHLLLTALTPHKEVPTAFGREKQDPQGGTMQTHTPQTLAFLRSLCESPFFPRSASLTFTPPHLSICSQPPVQSQGCRAAGSSVLSLHFQMPQHSSTLQQVKPCVPLGLWQEAINHVLLLRSGSNGRWFPDGSQVLSGQQKTHLPSPSTRSWLAEPQEELPLTPQICYRSILAVSFPIETEIMYEVMQLERNFPKNYSGACVFSP